MVFHGNYSSNVMNLSINSCHKTITFVIVREKWSELILRMITNDDE